MRTEENMETVSIDSLKMIALLKRCQPQEDVIDTNIETVIFQKDIPKPCVFALHPTIMTSSKHLLGMAVLFQFQFQCL